MRVVVALIVLVSLPRCPVDCPMEQSYSDAVIALCHTPIAIRGAHPVTGAFRYYEEHVTNPRARREWIAITRQREEAMPVSLRTMARRVGLTECALADDLARRTRERAQTSPRP